MGNNLLDFYSNISPKNNLTLALGETQMNKTYIMNSQYKQGR